MNIVNGITIEQLDSISSEKLIFNDVFENIPLIGSVIIDNNLWGRPDIIINKYYSGDMRLLKLLLDFNNVSDLTEVTLGTTFDLPDIQSLLDIITIDLDSIKNDEDNIIPIGINKSEDNSKVNSDQASKSNITIAVPKLQIQLEKVKYNSETGILSL